MSEQNETEFERRLRALLTRTAEAIPNDSDISARVRQASARGMGNAGGDGVVRVFSLRNMPAVIAAALVVALLAGTLTFARLGELQRSGGGMTGLARTTPTPTPALEPGACRPQQGPGGTPAQGQAADTPTTNPGRQADDSEAIGLQSSAHGITITVDRAYADATQTVITYHMQTNINPPLPEVAVLMDARGQRYPALYGDWDITQGGMYVFSPLPVDELGTPQTLTFFAKQMRLASSTGTGALVDGPWQITLHITPKAGRSVALSTAPVTHRGITIQPLRLDVAPAGGGIDGRAGGVRVALRISGLAPGMRLYSLAGFDKVFIGPSGGGSSSCGGGALMLILPGGRVLLPGAIALPGLAVATTSDEQSAVLSQTVGPSGTADVEALFYTPILSGTEVTLRLDRVPAQVAGAASVTKVDGPWEFRLTMLGA